MCPSKDGFIITVQFAKLIPFEQFYSSTEVFSIVPPLMQPNGMLDLMALGGL